MNNIVRILF